jgi:DNA-binding phage protein
MARRTEYQQDPIEALKNPEETAAYLNAVLEEGNGETFLLALRNVAEANGEPEQGTA